MDENATKARIKSKTGIDCVIAWLECYMTYVENDRNTSKNGWRQMMADFRSGKPMIGMIGTWRDVWARERGFEPMPQECPMDWVPRGATYENLQEILKHNPDYYFNILSTRRGRKARRDAESEAVTAETVARMNGEERAMNDVMLECEALKVLERSQSPVSTDALGNEVSFRLERHITKDEFGFMMCKLERLGLVSRSNTALMREVWAITDKGRQALKEEIYACDIKVNI